MFDSKDISNEKNRDRRVQIHMNEGDRDNGLWLHMMGSISMIANNTLQLPARERSIPLQHMFAEG